MTIKSMKEIKFPKRTYEEWQTSAEKAIGGKPFEQVLKTKTIEGVTLEPLYTKEMIDQLGDQQHIQAEVVKAGKRHPGWLVAQEVTANTAADFLAKVKGDLERGNEVIVYTSAQGIEWEEQELEQLAGLILQHPFYFKLISEDLDILRVFDFIAVDKQSELQGVIYSEAPIETPRSVRSRLIDTIPVHNAGGSVIHELGVALSILAEELENEEFSKTVEDLWIRFAVDTQFFQEISKLRAFRVLWKAFSEAYGKEADPIPVFTETSVRSYSKLDPYVNLLRAGNATFSAVLGGTDVHTVHPHDFLTVSEPSSRRIARNVQLVIKEESHVSHVIDVSAGSYFIEQLTRAYVEAAWDYFLAIEKAGGYSEVIKSGWLTDDIQAKWLQREEETAARKVSLIGTNIYANPQEAVKEDSLDSTHMEYMTAKRLAEPFEKLRARSRETELKTAVVHLDPLKEVKKKSDFVVGFLAVGGIEPAVTEELPNPEAVSRYLSDNQIDYAVLCGPEEKLESWIPKLETHTVLDLAGYYPDEQIDRWKKFGVHDSISSGKNIVTKLEQILNLGKKAF